jgi:hypothetical protein
MSKRRFPFITATLAVFLASALAHAVNVETVPVGNAGNAGNPHQPAEAIHHVDPQGRFGSLSQLWHALGASRQAEFCQTFPVKPL